MTFLAKCPICSSFLIFDNNVLMSCPKNQDDFHAKYFVYFNKQVLNTETFWFEKYILSNDYVENKYFIYDYIGAGSIGPGDIGKLIISGEGSIPYSPTVIDFIQNMMVLK